MKSAQGLVPSKLFFLRSAKFWILSTVSLILVMAVTGYWWLNTPRGIIRRVEWYISRFEDSVESGKISLSPDDKSLLVTTIPYVKEDLNKASAALSRGDDVVAFKALFKVAVRMSSVRPDAPRVPIEDIPYYYDQKDIPDIKYWKEATFLTVKILKGIHVSF